MTEGIRGCKLTATKQTLTQSLPLKHQVDKMKFVVPVFLFVAVAAFHSGLCASLESAEKEEKEVKQDGLTSLQKIDQMEFEAAQKREAFQMNVTEEQNEDSRYQGAVLDDSVEERADDVITEGGGNSETAAPQESESNSSEEDGRQKRGHNEAVTEAVGRQDETTQDTTKEKDVLE